MQVERGEGTRRETFPGGLASLHLQELVRIQHEGRSFLVGDIFLHDRNPALSPSTLSISRALPDLGNKHIPKMGKCLFLKWDPALSNLSRYPESKIVTYLL